MEKEEIRNKENKNKKKKLKKLVGDWKIQIRFLVRFEGKMEEKRRRRQQSRHTNMNLENVIKCLPVKEFDY